MVVADASPLIVLAKMQRLQLFKQVYERVVIGQLVKAEVVDQGKAIMAPGVEQVEQALEQGWIQQVRLTVRERGLMRRLLESSRLHEGEAEALSLAHARGLTLIVDDREARGLAAALGVAYLGTAGVLLEAFLGGHVRLEEFEGAIADLSKVMWLSPAVVAEILKRAREASE